MQLTGAQFNQICEALVEAFDTAALRRLARLELDQKLEAVAGGENLSDLVFNLVTWAERQSRIEELIQGAHRQNGGSAVVQQLFLDSRSWATAPVLGAPQFSKSATPSLPRTLGEHADEVTSVTFSPDGATVASSSRDKTVRLWDLRTSAPAAVLEGHAGPVGPVTFSPDGRTLASSSGGDNKSLRLWDVRLGAALLTLPVPAPIVSMAFRPDGRTLACGYLDNSVRLWDLVTGAQLATQQGPPSSVWALAFSPDGRTAASGGDMEGRMMLYSSAHKIVRLWDVRTAAELRVLKGHREFVASVAFSPDGSMLASGSWDNSVRLWNAQSGALLATLKGHTKPVTEVAWHPDGLTVASGSWDNSVRLWDVRSRAAMAVLEGHTGFVNSVAFSPDGGMLASGSSDKSVRLWPMRLWPVQV